VSRSATGILTISGVVTDGETVTIGSRVYEFDTDSSVSGSNVVVDVSAGLTAAIAVVALAQAINGDGSSVVSAVTDGASLVTVTADTAGNSGNSIAVAETCANATWGSGVTTLSGGSSANSYATLAQFKSWFAGEGPRLSDHLQSLVEATQNERIQELLDEATARIDSAAAIGGYEVPIDTAAAPMATERGSLLAKLCIDLCVESMSPGQSVIPEGFRQTRSRAQEFLDGLMGSEHFDGYGRRRRGSFRAELPGLTRSGV